MVDGNKDKALGLGERLRSARKARALTLEQAAFSIRLSASVLRALEDERFDVLGAAVFVRGHLKAYAKLLGLSEEAVMAAYRAADPQADAPPKVTRELEKPLTTTPGPITIAVAVLIAAVAILLLYLFSSGKESPPAVLRLPDSSLPVETGTAPAPMPAPEPLPVPASSEVDSTAETQTAPATMTPGPAPAPAANIE